VSESFQAAFIRCADPLRVEVTEVDGREPFEVFTESQQREYPFSGVEADGLLADLGYERTAPWKTAGDEWGAPVTRHVLSACCGYPVAVRGRTTNYYVCLQCRQACDVKAS
jgi:hypothetical protein